MPRMMHTSGMESKLGQQKSLSPANPSFGKLIGYESQHVKNIYN